MDNVGDWLYLVFIAVAAVGSLFKGRGQKKDPVEMDEAFPMFDDELASKPSRPFVRRSDVVAPSKKSGQVSEPSVAIEADDDSSAGVDVRLDSAEDARRAFLYSEIFRRKY